MDIVTSDVSTGVNIETPSPMQDVNKVFEECKFGRFHLRLLLTAFAGIIASTLVTNSTSYLLPIAECDLDMNLRQKGLLTAMPYIGMFISSVLSGILVDTFGRILFMKIGYAGLFIFSLLSASSQNFETVAAGKFGEGLFSAVAMSGLTSITAEFCHPSVRDRVLLVQSSFAAMAQLACPLIAWAILTQTWRISLIGELFVLSTWNVYLYAISLWSLSAFILFTTIPESPKFLVTRKKFFEAKNILIKVYVENTRKNADAFPYKDLWNDGIQEEIKEKNDSKADLSLKRQLRDGLHDLKPLVQKPRIFYLIIIAAIQLIIVGTYNVLRLWFPQLSTIVEHYRLDGSQNLCALLDAYTATEKKRITNVTLGETEVCVPHISGAETYINSIIIGLVCIVPFFISGVVVNKVGKKNIMIACGFISIGGLLGIRWASSKTMMVSLFSIDVAILQTMKGLAQMVLVEVFPTTMRSLAMAIVMCVARVGTLVGHIGFPILLDMGCEIPFYVMTGMMICFIVLCLFAPKKKKE